MAQWTSVCTHAGTDYGFASSCSIVEYAVSGTPLRPCIHVAMVRTILLTKLGILCNFVFFSDVFLSDKTCNADEDD